MGQVGTQARGAATERAQAARQLGTLRRRLFFLGAAVSLAVPLLVSVSGASPIAWNGVQRAVGSFWIALLLYVLLLLTLLRCVSLPLSWYRGFQIAHRFGLSRQNLAAWLVDWCKSTAIVLALGTCAALFFYMCLEWLGRSWWWFYAACGTLAMVLLAFVTPYVFVPLFCRLRRLEDPALVGEVQRLSRVAQAEVTDVCTLDFSRRTVEANAAVIGLGRSRRVVLADTLIEQFDLREVGVVVAHELGHHLHRDVARLLIFQGALLSLGLALAAWGGEPMLTALGAGGGLGNPANLPILIAGAELYGLCILPLSNAWSRRVESLADAFALELTNDVQVFAATLRKLGEQNLAEVEPPRWAELVLHSHPSIQRRIQTALSRYYEQHA